MEAAWVLGCAFDVDWLFVGYIEVVVDIGGSLKSWLGGRRRNWYILEGCQQVFFAVLGCMWLVTFDTLRRFATEVGGMTKRLAVEALLYRSGVSKFFPFDNTMAEFMNLEHFAYVYIWGEGDYKYWVFSCDNMCDLVYFGELRDPYYLDVVGVQVCTNVFLGDVGRDTFQ